MNFLSVFNLITPIIDRIWPNPQEAEKAKIEMQKVLIEAQMEQNKADALKLSAQKDIMIAEIGKNNWASNWRAYLMMMCISIVGYNWILVSFFNAFLKPMGVPIDAVPVPSELWTLVTVGLGGYIGQRTVQSYSENKYNPDKAVFDVIREIKGSPLTQADVDLVNKTKNRTML